MSELWYLYIWVIFLPLIFFSQNRDVRKEANRLLERATRLLEHLDHRPNDVLTTINLGKKSLLVSTLLIQIEKKVRVIELSKEMNREFDFPKRTWSIRRRIDDLERRIALIEQTRIDDLERRIRQLEQTT